MNKRGFTLVELLAVILILGIIALIAIPTVNKVVIQAKEGAAENSILGYLNAVENYILSSSLTNNVLYNSTYEVSYLKTLDIDVKGTIPTSGWVTVQDSEVVEAKVCISKNLIEYDGENTKIKGTCTDEEMVYTESILHGTDPVITDKLVPVLIADDGKVTKADIKSNWYNYANKRWANAVILTGTDTYAVGTIIPEDAIQSYFVWVPRYKYKLFDLGNYSTTINGKPTINSDSQSIKIVFENKNTNISNGQQVGEYLSHPAFQAFDVNGIWVGKFETTGSIESLTSKPELSSIKNQKVGAMFTAAYNYNRNIDSHMMKNTEWGAAAYLSYSEYGINKEININNNSSYLTGYSSADGIDQTGVRSTGKYGITEDITKPYNTPTGYKASTTGNITGIYDMSGGTWEYTASYVSGKFGNSAFIPTDYDSKYFDIYNAASSTNSYNYRILGDATGEMGPFYYYLDGDGETRYHSSWNADNAYFIEETLPWAIRGGVFNYGILVGQFYFGRLSGGSFNCVSFRVVLAN